MHSHHHRLLERKCIYMLVLLVAVVLLDRLALVDLWGLVSLVGLVDPLHR
jgi:hypothetical protein